MQVQFVPTGEIMDTNLYTPQKGGGLGPFTQPVITTPAGYTPIQGTVTSGSPLFNIGIGGYWLYWYNQEGVRMAKWKMDDATAAATALTQIAAALAGGAPAITLASTGNGTWVAPGS